MGINPDKWLGKALNRLAESRRNHVMKALKKEYPVLAQYEALAQRGKHLTGYYRERVEKEIKGLSKMLLSDKRLMAQVMLRLPGFGRRIHQAGVERELGRNIK